MNREELIKLIKKADRLKDKLKAEMLYEQVLSEPGLSFKLQADTEILNVRWNRAVNLVALANQYFKTTRTTRCQPTRAHTCIEQALQEISTCRLKYKKSKDRKSAGVFYKELLEQQERIEEELSKRQADIPPPPKP